MVDKRKYIYHLMELYKQKTGEEITEEHAVQYFEELVALVGTVYGG